MLVGTASVARDYCPMRAPSAAAEERSDSHDCCKKGITGAKPSCCHSDSATGGPALLKSAVFVAILFASTDALAADVEAATEREPSRCGVAAHSPPPRVLRI